MIPFEGQKSLGPPHLLSRKDLIRVILRLQFEGWRSALQLDPALKPDQDEPYMNGRLYQGMVRVRTSYCQQVGDGGFQACVRLLSVLEFDALDDLGEAVDSRRRGCRQPWSG